MKHRQIIMKTLFGACLSLGALEVAQASNIVNGNLGYNFKLCLVNAPPTSKPAGSTTIPSMTVNIAKPFGNVVPTLTAAPSSQTCKQVSFNQTSAPYGIDNGQLVVGYSTSNGKSGLASCNTVTIDNTNAYYTNATITVTPVWTTTYGWNFKCQVTSG